MSVCIGMSLFVNIVYMYIVCIESIVCELNDVYSIRVRKSSVCSQSQECENLEMSGT